MFYVSSSTAFHNDTLESLIHVPLDVAISCKKSCTSHVFCDSGLKWILSVLLLIWEIHVVTASVEIVGGSGAGGRFVVFNYDRNVYLQLPQNNGTCAICRTKLSKNMPMIPNITLDNTVEKHIQALRTSGDEDWTPGGTKYVERNFRKE
jgi:hypothetical protein